MGRLIIKYTDNRLESFKCKSNERAEEIVSKRPNISEWSFYEQNERIPKPKKKIVKKEELSIEQIEFIMRKQGLI